MVRNLTTVGAALIVLALGVTGASANCAKGKINPVAAINSCTTIIEAADTPDKIRAAAYYNRGNAQRLLGNHEEAISDFSSAIEITPDDARLFNNRGRVHKMLGQNDAALADAENAVKLEPEKPLSYLVRGSVNSALGNADAANADWTTGFKIGGPGLIESFQRYHRAKGHYDGELDGQDSAELRDAMAACASEPTC